MTKHQLHTFNGLHNAKQFWEIHTFVIKTKLHAEQYVTNISTSLQVHQFNTG